MIRKITFFVRKAIPTLSIAIALWLMFFYRFWTNWAIGINLLFFLLLLIGFSLLKKNFKFNGQHLYLENDNRINLIAPMCFICLALIVTVARGWGYGVLNWHTLSLYVLVTFTLLASSAQFGFNKLFKGRQKEKDNKIFLYSLLFFYSYCLVIYVNMIGPVSDEVFYEGMITDLKLSAGRDNSCFIYIQTKNSDEYQIKIDGETCRNYKAGMLGCFVDQKGWLGLTTRSHRKCLTPHSSGTPNGAP